MPLSPPISMGSIILQVERRLVVDHPVFCLAVILGQTLAASVAPLIVIPSEVLSLFGTITLRLAPGKVKTILLGLGGSHVKCSPQSTAGQFEVDGLSGNFLLLFLDHDHLNRCRLVGLLVDDGDGGIIDADASYADHIAIDGSRGHLIILALRLILTAAGGNVKRNSLTHLYRQLLRGYLQVGIDNRFLK